MEAMEAIEGFRPAAVSGILPNRNMKMMNKYNVAVAAAEGSESNSFLPQMVRGMTTIPNAAGQKSVPWTDSADLGLIWDAFRDISGCFGLFRAISPCFGIRWKKYFCATMPVPMKLEDRQPYRSLVKIGKPGFG